jgi:hypothetical protein
LQRQETTGLSRVLEEDVANVDVLELLAIPAQERRQSLEIPAHINEEGVRFLWDEQVVPPIDDVNRVVQLQERSGHQD